MKHVTSFDGTKLDKIGYGTWTIGGQSTANTSDDERAMTALGSALDLGYRHFDTAEMYASGHSETLLGRAVKSNNIPRDELFITSKVHPSNLKYDQTMHAFEESLKRLDMDYMDLYLIHWTVDNMPLKETFKAFNELVEQGLLKNVGVSNFSIEQLKEAQSHSQQIILTNQVPYSLAHRKYAQNGMLDYCQENGIIFTAYSPVEQGGLETSEALQNIATQHGATSYQIALAWLVQQPQVATIPMSLNPQHQMENLAAADIVLSSEEMQRLTELS